MIQLMPNPVKERPNFSLSLSLSLSWDVGRFVSRQRLRARFRDYPRYVQCSN